MSARSLMFEGQLLHQLTDSDLQRAEGCARNMLFYCPGDGAAQLEIMTAIRQEKRDRAEHYGRTA